MSVLLFLTLIVSAVVILCPCGSSAQQGLYVSNSTHILQATSATVWTALPISVNLGRVVGLAIDVSDGFLFWSDIKGTNRGIYRSKLDGSGAEKLISDVLEVNSITVDWEHNHIYWTDSRRQTVEVADYNGKNRRVLVTGNLSSPRGIIANPDNSYLYWNDQGRRRIERSRLDGSDRQEIVGSGVYWPNQMDIDWSANKLLWVDAANHTLMKSDLDGKNVNRVASLTAAGSNAVYGLALVGSEAYVSVWKSGKILSVSSSGAVTEKASGLSTDNLFSMVFKTSGPPKQVSNVCTSKGCGKLCLPTSTTAARCSCPSFGGKVLQSDGKSCGDPSKILLFASTDPGQVGFISLDTDTKPYEPYIVAWSMRPVAVGYDPSKQEVYFSDVIEKKVRKVKLDGTAIEVLLDSSHGIGVVDGLVVDWKKQRLLYTNMGYQLVDKHHYTWHKIDMVSLVDLKDRRTIVSDTEKPRGLAIDDAKRQLYWTDWGNEPKLMRVNLDGSGKVRVTSGLDNPNQIVFSNNRLFLLDSHYKTRQTNAKQTATDGNMYVVSATSGSYKEVKGIQLKTPFGIALDKVGGSERIYVSDWDTRSIIRLTSNNWSANNPMASAEDMLKNIGMPTGLLYTLRTETASTSEPTCTSTCDVCLEASSSSTTCACSSYDAKIITQNTCKVPEKFLLFADMNSIKMVGLESSDASINTIQQHSSYLDNFVSLAYDSANKKIYFTDVNRRMIYYSVLGSAEKQLFYNASQQIDGMFLAGRKLYWTAFNAGHIASMSLDDTSTYKVLVSGLKKPRAVQVTDQYIFWTEWGSTPKIGRASLTGSDIRSIVTSGLKWPNGLFVDGPNRKLYFGDGDTKKIFHCDLEGSNLKELLYIRDYPRHIYSLKILGKFLFYTDWYAQSITRVNMVTGKIVHMVDNLMRPTEFIIQYAEFSEVCPSGHGCQEGCYTYPGGYECGCFGGKVLMSNGKTCESVPWIAAEDSQCTGGCSSKPNTVCAKKASSTDFSCQCKSGYNSNNGVCTACPVDKYNNVIGATECTACPAESSTGGATGQSACICANNKIWTQKGCESAYPGQCPKAPMSPNCGADRNCNSDADCVNQKCCTWGECTQKKCRDPVVSDKCYDKGKTYRFGTFFYSNKCTVCVCVKRDLVGGHIGEKVCNSKCKVVKTPPVFENCQNQQIFVRVIPDDRSTAAFTEKFKAKDYEGSDVSSVTRDPSLTHFSKGTHSIEVTATDSYSQSTTCKVLLKVQDKTKPRILCVDVNDSTHAGSKQVFWSDPVTTDNVDDIVTVTYDKKPGSWFPPGQETVVTTTATDSSGNAATCTFKVKLISTRCKLWRIPNGGMSKTPDGYEIICRQDKNVIHNPDIPKQFTCENGVLKPSLDADQKNQACMKEDVLKAKFKVRVVLPGCFDSTDYKNEITAIFQELCERAFPPEFKCHPKYVKVSCVGRSNKRDTTLNTVIQVEAETAVNASVTSTEAVKKLETAVKEVQEKFRTQHFKIDGKIPTTVDTVGDAFIGCDEGRMERDGKCYVCPAGTFYDATGNTCAVCAKNTYQNLEGQLQCQACPDDKKTNETGSYSSYQCQEELRKIPPPPPRPPIVIIVVVVVVIVILVIVAVIVTIIIIKKKKVPTATLR